MCMCVVCVCVCMCVCVCVCVGGCARAHARVCARVRACMQAYMHACMPVCMCACVHVSVCACVSVTGEKEREKTVDVLLFSQSTNTGPTSPNADPTTQRVSQGNHWSTKSLM